MNGAETRPCRWRAKRQSGPARPRMVPVSNHRWSQPNNIGRLDGSGQVKVSRGAVFVHCTATRDHPAYNSGMPHDQHADEAHFAAPKIIYKYVGFSGAEKILS